MGPTDGEMAAERAGSQTAAIEMASTALHTALVGLSGTEPTQGQIDAVDGAIRGLEAALAAAADVGDGVKGGYRDLVDGARTRVGQAEGTLTAMRDAAEEAEADAMAALGKALYAAMSGGQNQPTFPLLATDGASSGPYVTSAGVMLDPLGGVGSWDYSAAVPAEAQNPAAVTLVAGDPAGSLGGWTGTEYAATGTGTNIDGEIAYEAVVYGNQGEPTETAFAEAHDLDTGEEFLTVDTAAEYALVMADAFTHSGTQVHSRPERSDAVYVRGTYDGAPGEYRCTAATCSSTNDGGGAPSGLAGWTFTPDEGAMTSRPDSDYLFFGWWEARDGEGVAATTAFYGWAGVTANAALRNTLPAGVNPGTAAFGGGSATYTGAAAGRYAFSNVLGLDVPDSAADGGGRFTADAEMKAVFGAQGHISGTIDNFRLNGGTEDPGWSVALNPDDTMSTGGLINSTSNDNDKDDGTFWTIGETTAPESGQWVGNLYDERPGDPPAGDGSNLPTGIVGHFHSKFGEVGQMVGGFGVELEE